LASFNGPQLQSWRLVGLGVGVLAVAPNSTPLADDRNQDCDTQRLSVLAPGERER